MYKETQDELKTLLKSKNTISERDLQDLNSPISNRNAKWALTTIDNPYDPFVQFRDWLLYDVHNGYNSSGLLARLALTSDQLSEDENNKEIERAIDEFLLVDISGMYIKVKNPDYKEPTDGE